MAPLLGSDCGVIRLDSRQLRSMVCLFLDAARRGTATSSISQAGDAPENRRTVARSRRRLRAVDPASNAQGRERSSLGGCERLDQRARPHEVAMGRSCRKAPRRLLALARDNLEGR